MLWNLSIRSLPLPLNWHSPSLSHKTIHDTFIFPTCIFFIAGYASLHIPDVHMNPMVCTSFLFCIVVGCCRSREKRTALRRDLVKNAARLVSEDEDDEEVFQSIVTTVNLKRNLTHTNNDKINLRSCGFSGVK
mmetsp:Transcript_23700/g.34504  ORF Transcript_23700/g.34504 Transcript_23700/m.34504 type:complete len:133 (-) Transcript_23700:264-662(-)